MSEGIGGQPVETEQQVEQLLWQTAGTFWGFLVLLSFKS